MVESCSRNVIMDPAGRVPGASRRVHITCKTPAERRNEYRSAQIDAAAHVAWVRNIFLRAWLSRNWISLAEISE